jgi:membrane peptidoglycan carboxypeptidase
VVLDEMVRSRALTPQQRAEAIRIPVRVNPTLASQRAQYFTDWVDDQVRRLVGEPTEDLVVETTLDLPIQISAEQALASGIAGARGQGVQQGALVALDGEGRVRAYVGGIDYEDSQFDRAAMARRQAGSAFKPFVYLTAIERGRTPETPVVDEAIRIGSWEPKNYAGTFLGPITLQTALAQSVNTVAARLANEVGTGNVAATARRLGIRSPIQLDPSMALGAVEVSPLEMAQAYAPFANGGFLAPAWAIERVRTAGGKVLYDRSVARPARTQVIGSPALPQMNQMLRQVISAGTGTRARVAGYDLAGKTGTTSDYRDAWFVGYTGGFVAAVWLGRDDNTSMRKVTGGGAPAGVWQGFMSRTLPRLKAEPIPGGAGTACRQGRPHRGPSGRPGFAPCRARRGTGPGPGTSPGSGAGPAVPTGRTRSGDAGPGGPEGVKLRPLAPQPLPVRRRITDQVPDQGPEGWPVIGLEYVGAFMRRDVVGHRRRREGQAPDVTDRRRRHPPRRGAGPPAGAGVVDGDRRKRRPQGFAVPGGQRPEAGQGLTLQGAHHRAGEDLSIS